MRYLSRPAALTLGSLVLVALVAVVATVSGQQPAGNPLIGAWRVT